MSPEQATAFEFIAIMIGVLAVILLAGWLTYQYCKPRNPK